MKNFETSLDKYIQQLCKKFQNSEKNAKNHNPKVFFNLLLALTNKCRSLVVKFGDRFTTTNRQMPIFSSKTPRIGSKKT